MTNYRPWKILNVRLEEPLPGLDFISGIDGLYVVFWYHQVALGHARVPAEQLPLPAPALANIAIKAVAPAVGDHLFKYGFKALLPEVPKQAMPDPPPDLADLVALSQPLQSVRKRLAHEPEGSGEALTVSVAVCTRERPDSLRRCLASLMELGEKPFEILVVDNAPATDATRVVVAEFIGVRYLQESRIGLDNARNAALANGSGDIIAFTDDDVVVHPDWIRGIRRGFTDPKVLAITGLVLPAELETESQMIFEIFWSFNRGYRARVYGEEFMAATARIGAPVTEIGAGANMAFRREVRELVGEFDVRLDVGAAGCNGDSEYWYRILAEGWRCRYEPTAIVHHHHRREMESLNRQLFFYMRGYAASLLVQHERYGHVGNLRRLRRTIMGLSRRIGLRLRGRTRPRQQTLTLEILGCLDGVKYFLMNRQPRNSDPHE